MRDDRLGDDPNISTAITAVANARNDSYLAQDARDCIDDGVHPDELPSSRDYRWPYPDERDSDLSYRQALRTVLSKYYDKHGYPDTQETDS